MDFPWANFIFCLPPHVRSKGVLSPRHTHLNKSCSLKASKSYFDDMLCRQFARMKKAGVRPSTWLANHVALCELVPPSVPLHAVVASQGSWSTVSAELEQLMSHSSLGKQIFNMAGLAVNAHTYKTKITELLTTCVDAGFSDDAVATFKKEAEEAADAFKACWATQNPDKHRHPPNNNSH